MVRLLIPLIAVFLIWLLFFSSFSKRLRVGLSTAVVAAMLFGLWLDTSGSTVNTRRIQATQVVPCGVKGVYSYRTNFNLTICLQNDAVKGTVRRLRVRFDALQCDAGQCSTVSSSEEILNLSISPGEQVQHTDNIAFKQIPSEPKNALFAALVLEVWASR